MFVQLTHLRNNDGTFSLENKIFNPYQVGIIEPISTLRAKSIFSIAMQNETFVNALPFNEMHETFSVCMNRAELTAIHINGHCYYVLGHLNIITSRLGIRYEKAPTFTNKTNTTKTSKESVGG